MPLQADGPARSTASGSNASTSLRREMSWRTVCLDIGLAILRLCFGLAMLIGHGWGKLQTLLSGGDQFPDPLGIGARNSLIGAVSGEAIFAALLIIGLLSRISALAMAFTMAVAAFVVHSSDLWAKKELAFLYFAAALALIFTGPGRFSLDHLIFGRRAAAAEPPRVV